MITSLEAVCILYNYVRTSELMTGPQKPSGSLYKFKRPFNSDKEDVVINSLPMNNEDLQEGVLNFNIHVPNIGTGDSSQPNTARLGVLTKAARQLLDEVWHAKADYMFYVQQDMTYQDNDQSWYQNIRVGFKNVNI